METLNNKVIELLENGGMNWNVEKRPLLFQSEEEQLDSGYFGAIRSDNETCLGTCTKTYEVFQNNEMIELALRVAEHTGYSIDTPKVYGNGKRVGVNLIGKEKVLEYPKKGDAIRREFRMLNAHDGSGSLKLMAGNLTISCSNLLIKKFVSDQKTNIRHTANMRTMVEQALRGMDILEGYHETMFDEINRMIQTSIKPDEVNDMIEMITNVDTSKVNADGTSDHYSTRAINIAHSLFDSIKEEIDYKGSNVWGLVSGVTHFTTHKAGADNNREESKVFGNNLRNDNKAYEYGLELVGV